MSLLNRLFERLKKAAARRLWTWRLWIVFNVFWSTPAAMLAVLWDSARVTFVMLKLAARGMFDAYAEAWYRNLEVRR